MWIGGSGASQICIPGFFALVFGICHTNRRISIIWIVSGKNHQKIEFFEDPGKIARKLDLAKTGKLNGSPERRKIKIR
jgi:hypothetical protein